MDRKAISDIIADWRASYVGRIPKGGDQSIIAMTLLIEKILQEGHTYWDIASSQTAKKVETACVHQGPITIRSTKQKRDSWIAKTKDDWDIAVRRYRMEHIEKLEGALASLSENVTTYTGPLNTEAVDLNALYKDMPTPIIMQAGEIDLEDLEKPRPKSPERKTQPIKPEEMFDSSPLKDVIPSEPLINEELEAIIKAESGE